MLKTLVTEQPFVWTFLPSGGRTAPSRKASGIFFCVHHSTQEINSFLMQHDSFSFPSLSFLTPPIRPSMPPSLPRGRLPPLACTGSCSRSLPPTPMLVSTVSIVHPETKIRTQEEENDLTGSRGAGAAFFTAGLRLRPQQM